ncbi:MAG: TetR/AcrR family transcriptional regulator [Candidatus Rokubacteria bacterium]|nr:TetR/AcrR family transcriptional regulator [Candidatus Rokubacteria bacterium]
MRKRPGRLRPGHRRKSYHHGDLRRALLDAARELVQTAGAEALTLRAAARLAGVSQAAPYRHFADKRTLLAAVAEEGFRALTEAMRQATAMQSGDPLSRFRALGLSYVGFAVDHPAHFRVMFGRETADKAAHPGLREAAEETFAVLVDALTECQRAGLARPGDPAELAISAWAAVHGLSALLLDGQLGPGALERVEELARSVTGVLFLGLGPERP